MGLGWGLSRAFSPMMEKNRSTFVFLKVQQPFRSVAQPRRAAERSQDVLQQNDWVERRFVFWWTRKNDRLTTFTQTFIPLPVPQDPYQMSFSTSSVPWRPSDHIAAATCLAYKNCGNRMMSFAYKTDRTTHSNAVNIYSIITSDLLIVLHTFTAPILLSHKRKCCESR